MAFDGAAPSALQPGLQYALSPAFEPMIPIAAARAPARAASEIAVHDRVALTLGYGAFGLCIGAAAALVVGSLDANVLAALFTVPAVAAAVFGRSCLRALHWSALPLVALIVGAAVWAIASATFPARHDDMLPAIGLFALALPLTSIACCRAFPAAFAVSMLGMALAAPVGAATMLSVFA